jgi:NAD(P)-dependent dehydrogenase (short-subunit alcohol dehydrogenase family)
VDLGLAGRRILVTGGSSGIGLAAVRLFLAEGAKVAFCARDAGRLNAVAAELSAQYGDAVHASACDVLDDGAVKALIADVTARFGGLDVLVNNAGQGRVSTFTDTTDEDWEAELRLKFFSVIRPTRAARAALAASGIGAVVCVNSLLARQPEPHMVCTSAARAGVQNLVKSLSVELAPEGIRVNSILLGLVDSGQWQRRFAARADQNQTRDDWYAQLAKSKHIPLGRLGEPEEAARAVVFLASPAAAYITGAALEVSGGVSRHA